MKLIPDLECKTLADLAPGELAVRCTKHPGILIPIEKYQDNPDCRFLTIWKNKHEQQSVTIIEVRTADARKAGCLSVGTEWTVRVPIGGWEGMPPGGWHEGALINGSDGLIVLAVDERMDDARFVSLVSFDTTDMPKGSNYWTKAWDIGLIHDADDQFDTVCSIRHENEE